MTNDAQFHPLEFYFSKLQAHVRALTDCMPEAVGPIAIYMNPELANLKNEDGVTYREIIEFRLPRVRLIEVVK